eukprot:14841437-Alexandrium_andersonii.AAC.1
MREWKWQLSMQLARATAAALAKAGAIRCFKPACERWQLPDPRWSCSGEGPGAGLSLIHISEPTRLALI